MTSAIITDWPEQYSAVCEVIRYVNSRAVLERLFDASSRVPRQLRPMALDAVGRARPRLARVRRLRRFDRPGGFGERDFRDGPTVARGLARTRDERHRTGDGLDAGHR